jgi:hypothetical protein
MTSEQAQTRPTQRAEHEQMNLSFWLYDPIWRTASFHEDQVPD